MSNPHTPPPIPPRPLDYGDERSRPSVGTVPYFPALPRQPIFSVARFIVTTLAMLILLGIFLVVMPRLETVYKDFGTKLPAVTVVMLSIGRLMNTPGGWFFGLLIAVSTGVLVAVLPLRGRGLRLLLVLLLALIVVALALAVLLPLVNLMESISGGGKI